MAAVLFSKEYTLTGALVSLTTIVGSRRFFRELVIRAGSANAATTYVGTSDLTISTNRGGFLAADESLALSVVNMAVDSGNIYFIGTSNDKIHILGIE
jgi:hypothetical protein